MAVVVRAVAVVAGANVAVITEKWLDGVNRQSNIDERESFLFVSILDYIGLKASSITL